MAKKHIGIILILLLAAFLRFHNLSHDAPYFFDPDERNMASAITQFKLPSNLLDASICILKEFNLTVSSNQKLLTDTCTLNPHFFAYGQFPLYLAYVSDQIPHLLPFNRQRLTDTYQPAPANQELTTSFSSAIYWLRFWSALASTMTVLLVYKIVKLLFKKPSGIPYENVAALLTAFIPGLIQSAHFGTTESLLTFFFLCSLYFSLKFLSSYIIPDTKYLILTAIACGLAIGSKMTGVFFLTSPCLSIGFHFLMQKKKTLKDVFLQAFTHLRILAFFLITTAFVTVVSSPYNLVDPSDFLSAVFGYEADVARGKYEAFYTRQFVHTTPIVFQFEKIFPYSLGIVLTIIGTIGFLILIFKIIFHFKSGTMQNFRKIGILKPREDRLYGVNKLIALAPLTRRVLRGSKKILYNEQIFYWMTFLIVLSFLIYLIPNAFLFAKWSRFMTPILPFFVIFALYLFDTAVKLKRNKFLIVICYLLFVISLLQGFSFFSIYTRPDSRFTASRWIYKNIPSNTVVLSETANVIDIPIPPPSPVEASEKAGFLMPSGYTLSPISFDFYHLDENPELQIQLITFLEKADYIFIPSRRIFANYTKEPAKYPVLNRYYVNLFNGNLGFEKVAEISSFPHLDFGPPAGGWNLDFDDEQSEETYTVFDHPVIRIYKKNQSKTAAEYQKLLL